MEWQEQWDRVLLGLRRVEQIYAGREGGSAEAVYDLYSFFLHAYHLRDWLAADPATGLSSTAIDAAIQASTVLGICGDFANRVKHVVLTRKPWRDAQTGVTRQNVVVRPATVGSQNVGSASHSWTITSEEQEYDALELAKNVVRAWEELLKGHDLL